jgi:NAD(P)-dependent dehydrogenase (short-subunit alcohol dehydrogenase family)
MSWTTADIPDLTGRVAVVTGGNGGLGLESARALAGAGAHVVIAARDSNKAAIAVADIKSTHPNALLEVAELDLASLKQIKAAAKRLSAAHPAIDILMNNAGLMALPERKTVDGFEMQLGVNHLGHWALTSHLMPSLLAADAARVVTVSSTARTLGKPLDPTNPHMHGTYSPWTAYGNSKLANLHFAIGLQQKFEQAGIRAESLAAHPGLSRTNLQVHTAQQGGVGASGPFWQWMARYTGMPASRGALSQLRAATDPAAVGGEFYGPKQRSRGIPVQVRIVRDEMLELAIDNLWKISEDETGVSLKI